MRTSIREQPFMSRILDDPKKVKALIKSFQIETRSTRAQRRNPFYIPEGITLDEHYDLAMEPERTYKNMFVETTTESSSQLYPHQAHILPPRRIVNHQPTTY